MLIECFEKIGEMGFVRALRTFLGSVWAALLAVALMVCSNLFSLELPVFYLFLALGILHILFCDDLKGVLPICLCCYMSVSYENNPALFPPGAERPSSFYDPAFVLQVGFLIVVAVFFLAARLITVRKTRRAPALWFGFLVLTLSLVLGGIFSGHYSARTAVFGLAVAASLGGLYFLFLYGIDWKKGDAAYFAHVFMIIGFGVIAELIGMYVRTGREAGLNRGVLITGWGMYNNLGCIIACCMPAAVYLAATKKHGWLYTCASVVLAAGLIFTQSRSSILFGGAVYLAALVVMFVVCKKKERIAHGIVIGVSLAAAIVLAAVFWERIVEIFKSAIDMTFGDDPSNNRKPIYQEGWRHFLSAPCFGVGFYQCTAFRWGALSSDAFLPPRYHNTIIQMMAACGIFGLVCYLWHRAETVIMIFRRPSCWKTTIALCILPLLLTSLVECHMFSFGPAMFYGVFLALAELSDRPASTA